MGTRGSCRLHANPMIPKRVNTKIRQTYVHSSIVYMPSKWLKAGVANLYNIDLEVGQEPPSHASVATIKWKSEVIVDVTLARDIKKRHKANIALS